MGKGKVRDAVYWGLHPVLSLTTHDDSTNTMSTKHLSLFLALLFLVSCTTREVPVAEAPFKIPELKPRLASLSPTEFKSYRSKYDELSRSIRQNPEKIDSYVEMAQLFMNEARITGDHPYYYPAAKSLLDQALKRDSNNFGALISLGSIQLSLHQFSEAAETGKRAVAISPYSNYPWGILCDASLELGDYNTAVMAADSMVAIRPDLRSYARVSYLREIHGDITGAIEAMDMAVKAGVPGKEEKAWARFALGNLYYSQGDLSKAEKEYTMALAERPNYAFALMGLAKISAAKGKHDVALHLLDSASTLVPEFSFAQMKADILHVQGKLNDEAAIIREIETMLKEDEASGHAMDREFAMLYATRNMKHEEAEIYARKEYAKRPRNSDAQVTLAIALLRSGKLEEADALMQSAIKLYQGKTMNAEHLAYMGLIARAKNDKQRTTELLNKSLRVNPHLNPLLLREVKVALENNS